MLKTPWLDCELSNVQVEFRDVSIRGDKYLFSSCAEEWCRHCLTPAYFYFSDGAWVTVIDRHPRPLPSEEYYSRSQCQGNSDHVYFSLTSSAARLSFVRCGIAHIRWKASAFIAMSQGTVTFAQTEIEGLDFTNGFLVGTAEEIRLTEVLVTGLNRDHPYMRDSGSDSGLISAFTSVFQASNCSFVDNFLQEGHLSEGSHVFLSLSNATSVLISDCQFDHCMGGIALQVHSLLIISFSSFRFSYSVNNPVLALSAVSPALTSLNYMKFEYNGSEGKQELMRITTPASAENAILMEKCEIVGNQYGGGSKGIFLIEGGSNLRVKSCKFEENGAYQSLFDVNIFTYMLSKGLLNPSSDLEQRKIVFEASCEIELNVVNVENVTISNTSFSTTLIPCWYSIQFLDPGINSALTIAEVQDCYFTSAMGYAVSIAISNFIPSCYIKFRSCHFEKVHLGSIYFETYSTHAAGIAAEDTHWVDNGSFDGDEGDIQMVGGGYLNLTGCSFRGSKGTRAGAVYMLMLSVKEGLEDYRNDAFVIVVNCTFYNNVSPQLGGDLYITTSQGTSPLSVLIKDSLFEGSRASVGAGAFALVNMRISQGLIVNCTFTSVVSNQGGAVTIQHIYGEMVLEKLTFVDFVDPKAACIAIKTSTAQATTLLRSLTFKNNTVKAAVLLAAEAGTSVVLSTRNEFRNNRGVAVWNDQGDFTDSDSVFEGNRNDLSPGYFQAEYSVSSFLRSTFAHNLALEQAGAIYIRGPKSSANFTLCVFRSNRSLKQAGVLYIEKSCQLTLQSCLFLQNEASEASVMSLQKVDKWTSIGNSTFEGNRGEGLMEIDSSNVKILKSRLFNNIAGRDTGGFLLIKANLTITDSVIGDLHGLKGCLAYGYVSSRVEIVETSIRNVSCRGEIMAFSSESEMEITNSSLSGLKTDSASLFTLSVGNFTLLNSQFSDISVRKIAFQTDFAVFSGSKVTVSVQNCTFSHIDVSLFLLTQSPSVLITASEFLHISALHSSAGVLYCHNCQLVRIVATEWRNIEAVEASGMLLRADAGTAGSVSISKSKFTNMRSQSYGTLAVINSTLEIIECVIANSSAESALSQGGGVYFSCPCLGSIVNSTFSGNKAYSGGAIYWDLAEMEITHSDFEGNSAAFGPNAASRPVALSLLTPTAPLASGQVCEGVLTVAVVDYYGQVWTIDNTSAAWLSSGQASASLQGSTKAGASLGLYRFSGFAVLALPGSVATLQVTTSALDPAYIASLGNTSLSAQLSIVVDVRLCAKGEIQRGLACVVCPADTYSLIVNASACKACPAEATCKGGATFYPRPGYWRPSDLSESLLECPRTESCLGSDNYTSLVGSCAQGYHGNLCQTCDSGYSRTERDACSLCPESAPNVVRLVLVSISLCGFLVYTIRSAFASAAKELNLQGVYMKILMNYLQSVVLTSSFSLNWPLLALKLFQVQRYAGEANEQILSFECFSQGSSYPFPYQKLILVALLPVAMLLIPALYWLLHIRKQSLSVLRDKYITSVTILLFAMYPLVTRTSFSVFNCMRILPSEWWLRESLGLRCWDAMHSRIAFGAALPSILLWGLGIPISAAILLKRKRRKLRNPIVKAQFGFLYLGFGEKTYYWEFLVLGRKVGLVAVNVFLSSTAPAVQGLLVFSLLSVALGLQLKYAPYFTAELNSLEVRYILVAEITIYCGLFFLSQSLAKGTELVLFTAMVLANTYFVLYWGYCYCQVLLLPVAKKSPELLLKWCKCLPLLNKAALKALKTVEEEHAPNTTGPGLADLESMNDLYLCKVRQELQSRGVLSTEREDEDPPVTSLDSLDK